MSSPVRVTGHRPQGAAAPARRYPPDPGSAGQLARGQLQAENGPGGGGVRLDRTMSGHAASPAGGNCAAAAGPLSPAEDLAAGLVCADDLPDGLVIADRDGRVAVFNRAASRLTGINPESALGRDVQQVLPLRDDEDRSWWAQTRPYHGLCTRTRHPERPLYLPDGTELLVSVGYVRDWCEDGRPGAGRGRAGHASETRDRWHHHPGAVRRLAITLRDARLRSRAERNRADLVSTVAHELRSPLTSVKGFTATLLAKWPRFTDDQKRVMLETVNADADRVTRLITELLDVSRIESGRIEVHRQLVDVPDRARKIVAGRVAAGDAEDRFRLEVLDGLPETWLDADKIDQILGNLVENAVRHGAGIVTIVVEPACLEGEDEKSDAVAVSVRDQGEGISPDVAPRVFRQFW